MIAQRVLVVLFAILLGVALFFFGGRYAMGLCVLPSIFFVSFLPHGASMLVNLIRKQKASRTTYIRENAPVALLPSKEQLTKLVSPKLWFKKAVLAQHLSFDTRVRQAADNVSFLCIRLMAVNLLFILGSIMYAGVAFDYLEYEKGSPAGSVNVIHFTLLVSFAFAPVMVLEVLRYLKVTLKGKMTRKVTDKPPQFCRFLRKKPPASKVYSDEDRKTIDASVRRESYTRPVPTTDADDDLFAFEVIQPINAVVPAGTCQFNEDWKVTTLSEKRGAGRVGYIFTFLCPDPTKPLDLTTCACILMKGSGEKAPSGKDGAVAIRPYTPISTNALVGKFEIMVKMYEPAGVLSSHLNELEIGAKVEFFQARQAER